MTLQESTALKVRQLPEPLVREVNDFIDFLIVKHDNTRWQLWSQFSEGTELAEADMDSYLRNLEQYENELASGKIQW